MSVRLTDTGLIELSGVCTLEDGEKLQQCLLASPEACVDWRSCTSAHTTVIQILMAAQPVLLGPPQNHFLQNHLGSVLKQ